MMGKVLAALAVVHEVKKSRFVARVSHATSWPEAQRFIESVSDSSARHNCYCWVGSTSARSSDDGEPSGTAGKPIREAIASAGIEDVVVVVTRHKPKTAPLLGAGGLVRAYGAAARLALADHQPPPKAAARRQIVVSAPLDELGALLSFLASWGDDIVERQQEVYDATSVSVQIDVGEEQADKILSEAERLKFLR